MCAITLGFLSESSTLRQHRRKEMKLEEEWRNLKKKKDGK
jgi:hypothetical protein